MPFAEVVVRVVEGYLIVGAGFAAWFAARGAVRLDPVAGRGTVGFRILLIPGATLLWPRLVYQLARRTPERRADPVAAEPEGRP